MRISIFAVVLLSISVTSGADSISTVAGTGLKGFSGDGGPATAAQLNNVFGMTRGSDGALYICDCDNQVIRRIDTQGTMSTVAGVAGKRGYSGDGGLATAALMNEPYEVRSDSGGNLLVVERLNHVVRRLDGKSGVISTVAGTGVKGFGGDGSKATGAMLNQPHAIALDRAGDLYICDIINGRIRRVAMKSGIIDTFAGTGVKEKTLLADGATVEGSALAGPRAMAFDSTGNTFIALREGNAVYRIDQAKRTYQRIAGTGKSGFTGNGGPAKEAALSSPKGIALDAKGRVYLCDTESHTIRRIDPATGLIDIVAGTGKKGDGPDGDPLKCGLNRPHGIFIDTDGTIYIGDSENHRVRKLVVDR